MNDDIENNIENEEVFPWYEQDETIEFDDFNGFWRDYDFTGNNKTDEFNRFIDESSKSGLIKYQFKFNEDPDCDHLHIYYSSNGLGLISIKEYNNGELSTSIFNHTKGSKSYSQSQLEEIAEKMKHSLSNKSNKIM